ncbi:imidazole glycerol phosphate synthase subunit HisH [Pontibacillus marinus]|uniref:Imidazole glycerol phosphate synthase subunit HisH n=1 Tax=Pontibacillus marinus BH030004 = DSM 16465 TaxID=1385511 RepID=A0A0A5FZG7_9BACI|nr:imidazole glycerol phosphate synthase subunit HisH [Pontibacillus marinus]KGX84215.1 imidazole glycerol phosphate synthase [Pontibacillus marinus BH030004 = DSM 16465]
MIGIIDYGMGNLYSVSKALERLDVSYTISDKWDELDACEGLLLPGVGAFPDAMSALNESGMADFLRRKVEEGVPLLGICLGMQLLFEESEEVTPTKGLGFLPGKVVRFKGVDENGTRYKIPHMGWNLLNHKRPDSILLRDVVEDYVYFVHSFYVDTKEDVVVASANYETEVPAIVGKGHVLGAQFHPEKSSSAGMAILKNYCQYVYESNHKGVIE